MAGPATVCEVVAVPSDYPAYLGVVLLVVVVPGQDFVLVLRNCLLHGRLAGLVTGLGMVASLLIQGLAAALGVAAVIVKSDIAFTVVRILGAAYLGYLGIQALRSALAGGPRPDDLAGGPTGPHRRVLWRSARQGLLSNITNPKVLVFYLSLLPQFVDQAHSVLPQVLVLALTHALLGLLWVLVVVGVVDKLRASLRKVRLRRVLEGATGVVFIALGVRLIAAG